MLLAGKFIAKALIRAASATVFRSARAVLKSRASGLAARIAAASAEILAVDFFLREITGWGLTDLVEKGVDVAVDAAFSAWADSAGDPSFGEDADLVTGVFTGTAGEALLAALAEQMRPQTIAKGDVPFAYPSVGLPFRPGPGESMWEWAARVEARVGIPQSEALRRLVGFVPSNIGD
jgi:hypothetical protein